jgi:hypothetical protein
MAIRTRNVEHLDAIGRSLAAATLTAVKLTLWKAADKARQSVGIRKLD